MHVTCDNEVNVESKKQMQVKKIHPIFDQDTFYFRLPERPEHEQRKEHKIVTIVEKVVIMIFVRFI